MSDRAFQLDMTMMYAFHAALRRELHRIARLTARPDGNPTRVLATAAGWEMFKTYLRVHHTSEDEAIWPVMEQALAGQPAELALLEAMEAEHAAIDPLLSAIDAALVDRDDGPHRLGDLADELVTTVRGHLLHEENEALPLIDSTMTPQQWHRFSEVHRDRIGTVTTVTRFLPWLLEGASDKDAGAVLSLLPPAVRTAYQDEWRPAYARLDLWDAGPRPAAG